MFAEKQYSYEMAQSKHPLYSRWRKMHYRCYDPKSSNYPLYGERGIKVCQRWHDFKLFVSDVGLPPSPTHTLDRIENDRDYEPGNVRWATIAEQSVNKRSNHFIEYEGRRLTVRDWAQRLGMHHKRLRKRLELGWTIERAFTQPVIPRLR